MSFVSALSKNTWVGRSDGFPKDRFHSRVIPIALEDLEKYHNVKYVLIGFSCDEGVSTK